MGQPHNSGQDHSVAQTLGDVRRHHRKADAQQQGPDAFDVAHVCGSAGREVDKSANGPEGRGHGGVEDPHRGSILGDAQQVGNRTDH